MATHQHKGNAPGSEFPSLTAMMPDAAAFDGFQQSSQACMQACTDWRNEVMRFVDTRLRADEQFGAAIGGCKTLAEIAEVQRNWAMSATQDYFEEGQRLAQIMAGAFPSWPAGKQPSPRKEG